MPDSPSWILILATLALGFWFLMKGATWLVDSSSQIARRIGISAMVVGLTVVAFGTSAPEIVVSALAAFEGKVDLSLGNVLGSNVANVGLVLGACAVVLPPVLQARLEPRELFWLFASLALFWIAAANRSISRVEGLALLAAFVAYNVHVLAKGRRLHEEDEPEGAPEPGVPPTRYRRPLLWTLLGIVSIAGGAKLVVMGAEWGALRIGIPQSVIGLTVVAVGTSLPELAAGLGGALRGEKDISLGNVVGSNVFNLLAVIGLVAAVQPFDARHGGRDDPAALEQAFVKCLDQDLYVVLGFSVAAVLLPWLGGARGGRMKGLALLAAYGAYTYWLYVSRSL